MALCRNCKHDPFGPIKCFCACHELRGRAAEIKRELEDFEPVDFTLLPEGHQPDPHCVSRPAEFDTPAAHDPTLPRGRNLRRKVEEVRAHDTIVHACMTGAEVAAKQGQHQAWEDTLAEMVLALVRDRKRLQEELTKQLERSGPSRWSGRD